MRKTNLYQFEEISTLLLVQCILVYPNLIYPSTMLLAVNFYMNNLGFNRTSDQTKLSNLNMYITNHLLGTINKATTENALWHNTSFFKINRFFSEEKIHSQSSKFFRISKQLVENFSSSCSYKRGYTEALYSIS